MRIVMFLALILSLSPVIARANGPISEGQCLALCQLDLACVGQCVAMQNGQGHFFQAGPLPIPGGNLHHLFQGPLPFPGHLQIPGNDFLPLPIGVQEIGVLVPVSAHELQHGSPEDSLLLDFLGQNGGLNDPGIQPELDFEITINDLFNTLE